MHGIERQFNAYFEHWNIRMPAENLAQRRPGRIRQAGWMICYRFDTDEQGDYLDFYACHRMTNDRHVRLYANGTADETLPALREFRLCSDDPEEDRRLQEEYLAYNQSVADLLDRKGFGLQGDEPMAVQMNRRLRTTPDERKP